MLVARNHILRHVKHAACAQLFEHTRVVARHFDGSLAIALLARKHRTICGIIDLRLAVHRRRIPPAEHVRRLAADRLHVNLFVAVRIDELVRRLEDVAR